jgi:predicted RecA/RadA family phage recombinase
MAQNFVQRGASMTLTPPIAVASGDGYLFGSSLFGIALHDVVANKPGAFGTEGVWELPKIVGESIEDGTAILWDTVNKRVSANSGSCAIGIAQAASSSAKMVSVLINTASGGGVSVTKNTLTGVIEIIDPNTGGTVPFGGGGSGEISGLVAGDVGAAAANTTLINAALAGKGLVQITTPGTYHVVSDLTDISVLRITNDTDFYVAPGVRILGPALGTVYPIIVNKNWRSNKGSPTSVTSATANHITVVTVAEAGHTRAVGDAVLLKGDTSGYYNGVHRITGVTAGVSYTFRMVGFGSAPPAGAGTIITYAADADFTIRGGGVFDQNDNSNSSNFQRFCSIFNKVGNAKIYGTFAGASKYAITYCNAWDTEIMPGSMLNPSDGVHGCGPLNRIRVGGFFGSAGDDIIAITANNTGYTAYDFLDADGTKNSDGACEDLTFMPSAWRSGGSRTLLLAAGAGAPIKRAKIIDQHKASNLSGFTVLLDAASAETGSLEDITIDGLHGNSGLNQAMISIGQVVSTVSIKDLKIFNVACHGGEVDGNPTGLTGAVLGGSNASCTIDGLLIDGVDVDCDLTNATGTVALVNFGGGSGVHTLLRSKISNVTARGTGNTRGANIFLANSNCQFDSVQIDNCSLYSNNSSLVNIASTQAGLGRVMISNSIVAGDGTNNGQAIVYLSGTKNIDVKLSNVLGNNQVQGGVSLNGNSKVFNIFMSNVECSNEYIVNNGSGNTINVWESSCKNQNYPPASTVKNIVYGTTPTWSFHGNCADFSVDLSLLGGRSDGAIVYNNNAVLGTLGAAGLVVCQGTAANSWRLMGDPTPVADVATTAATALVAGTWYIIATPGDTVWTSYGAPTTTAGTYFKATGAGTGTGTAYAVKPKQY